MFVSLFFLFVQFITVQFHRHYIPIPLRKLALVLWGAATSSHHRGPSFINNVWLSWQREPQEDQQILQIDEAQTPVKKKEKKAP